MQNNLSTEITKYISEKEKAVEAKEIYLKFTALGYSQGQVSGVLRRLKTNGKLVSPERGVYENTNSGNVLDELKRDLSSLLDKYNRSVPITIFTGLTPSDKMRYTEIINTLSNLL